MRIFFGISCDPLDGIIDKRADTRTVTEYGDHTVRPDPEGLPAPTGVRTPQIPHPEDAAELVFNPDETDYSEWAADRVASRAREQLSFDEARQSPNHIELWGEKTLPDYIRSRSGLGAQYGCNVVEGKGDLSLTVAYELAQRNEQAGKPTAISTSASSSNDWPSRPHRISQIRTPLRRQVRGRLEYRIEDKLRDVGINENLEDLEAWIDEFNDSYAAVADVFESLQTKMNDESTLGEWEDMVQSILRETEFPVATVPDGDAALPEDPIYDSIRSYVKN